MITNRQKPTVILHIYSLYHRTKQKVIFLDIPYHLINKRTESRIRLSVPQNMFQIELFSELPIFHITHTGKAREHSHFLTFGIQYFTYIFGVSIQCYCTTQTGSSGILRNLIIQFNPKTLAQISFTGFIGNNSRSRTCKAPISTSSAAAAKSLI